MVHFFNLVTTNKKWFLLFFIVLPFMAKAQMLMGPPNQGNKPSVFTEQIKKVNLYHIVNYGGRIQPVNSFPQNANYGGIVRQIAVTVGQRVSVGTPLYSVQQTMPGAVFQAGWVYAFNSGIVAQVSVAVGEQITTSNPVVVIADTSSYRIDFFIGDQDATRIKIGDPVYLNSLTRHLYEAEQSLQSLVSRRASPEDIELQNKKVTELKAEQVATVGQIRLLPLVPNLDTGLFSVRATFNGNKTMPIGRFEVLELRVDPYEGLALKQSYITKRYGRSNVTVVKEGKIEYQEVELGDTYGDMVAIIGGLEEGDAIVVGSSGRYRLGDEVEVSSRSASNARPNAQRQVVTNG